ncbi:MAG: cysteine--tRNA ligase [Pseudomonadota bacterium]
MDIALYDAMARKKRRFEPADPDRVTLYVCGPTVYDRAHIGNFRSAVAFDLLFRFLRHAFGEEKVVYARNFTDVDDKIIKAADKARAPIEAITEKYAKIYMEEAAALGCLTPTLTPYATSHLTDMITLVERLVDKGAAYPAEGHVLFDVSQYADYGALSGVDRDEMIAGARVEVAPYKKGPADFVLWKPAADDEPGWESPWGRGRPGWHLECSAMIARAFGEDGVDIHGGGQDVRFPHHENERAQSACAHGGAEIARYWLHNGFLRMGSDKMSKSLGNMINARDLLDVAPGEAIRWALLSAQYRQPLEWTDALLEQSRRQLDRFYRLFADVGAEAMDAIDAAPSRSVLLALADDLNTPEAFAGLHEARDIAMQVEGAPRARAAATVRATGRLMGFFNADPETWIKTGGMDAGASGPSDAEIDAALEERAAARARKDFAAADRIRDDLAAQGIVIEDGPDGATWRRG